MSDQNRRKHNRVKLKQVSTRVRAQGALHIGLAVDNVSMGGCFVRCPKPLKLGTEVTLEVMRPGASSPIPLSGRVVSTFAPGNDENHAVGMGVAFYPMPREVMHRIEGLVGAVDPTAVRATVEPSLARTDPAMPALGRAPGPPPAAESMVLKAEVAALTAQLKKRDARISELQAEVERLKQRLLLYGGKP